VSLAHCIGGIGQDEFAHRGREVDTGEKRFALIMDTIAVQVVELDHDDRTKIGDHFPIADMDRHVLALDDFDIHRDLSCRNPSFGERLVDRVGTVLEFHEVSLAHCIGGIGQDEFAHRGREVDTGEKRFALIMDAIAVQIVELDHDDRTKTVRTFLNDMSEVQARPRADARPAGLGPTAIADYGMCGDIDGVTGDRADVGQRYGVGVAGHRRMCRLIWIGTRSV
jgi:hypothetical protein